MCVTVRRDALATPIGEFAMSENVEELPRPRKPVDLSRPRKPGILFSVNEFCQRKGIGRTFFYRELKAGRIKAVKIGKLTKVTAEADEAYDRLISVAA
jgi:excisionase family DNA binding protein